MNDRLKELQSLALGVQYDHDDSDDDLFFPDFYQRAEKIKNNVYQLRQEINQLNSLYGSSLDFSKNKKQSQKEIDDLIDVTNKTAQRLRDELQRLGDEASKASKASLEASNAPIETQRNSKFSKGINASKSSKKTSKLSIDTKETSKEKITFTEARIKNNIHISLMQEFYDIMQEYESIQNDHDTEMHRLMKAQVQLVNPKATDDIVEQAIVGGSQTIFSSAKTKALNDYIQNKHSEILKLERSLEEVHKLFVDMSVVVEEQSELINSIAFQVKNAHIDIREATNNLRIANELERPKCNLQ